MQLPQGFQEEEGGRCCQICERDEGGPIKLPGEGEDGVEQVRAGQGGGQAQQVQGRGLPLIHPEIELDQGREQVDVRAQVGMIDCVLFEVSR